MNKYFYYIYILCLRMIIPASMALIPLTLTSKTDMPWMPPVLEAFSHKKRSYNTFARENCVSSKSRLLLNMKWVRIHFFVLKKYCVVFRQDNPLDVNACKRKLWLSQILNLLTHLSVCLLWTLRLILSRNSNNLRLRAWNCWKGKHFHQRIISSHSFWFGGKHMQES